MSPDPFIALLIFSLYLSPTLCNTNSITHTQIEDTPSFSSVLSIGGGCCIECAMRPINSFRSSRNCDAVDPFTCLCADKTLSVGLRTAISSDCFNRCGAESVKFGTMVLDGYCTPIGQTTSVNITATRSMESTRTDTSTTSALSGSEGRFTGTSSPTASPTIDSEGGGTKKEPVLTFAERLTVGITLSVGIPAVLFAGFGCWYQRQARKRKDMGESKGEEVGVQLDPMNNVEPPANPPP